jgi:hypothetical protein
MLSCLMGDRGVLLDEVAAYPLKKSDRHPILERRADRRVSFWAGTGREYLASTQKETQ